MKIQILSDLHLEFFQSYDKVLRPLYTPKADVVVLAGDIFSYTKCEAQMKSIRKAFKKTPLVYIPGNHEYYNTDKNQWMKNYNCCHQDMI